MVAVPIEHTTGSGLPAADPSPMRCRPTHLENAVWWAAVGAAVAVPAVSLLLGSPRATLAVPPVAVAALWCAVRYRARSDAALAAADARARAATVHDELTGCPNDAGLLLLGSRLLHDVRRRGDALHAFVVDVGLARQSRVPDETAAGDVLVAVGESLRTSVRGTDVVGRAGRDEFVVLGPGCGMQPAELERRVRACMVEAPPVPLDAWPCRVTVGKSVLQPWDGGELDELVRRAREDLQIRAAIRAPAAPEPPLPATS